jgi:hypothetical protein
MAQIFVSYASANRAQVLEILEFVRDKGVDFWIDRDRIPGAAAWSAEIARGIKDCKLCLLVASTVSLSSENVADEIEFAHRRGKVILPLWIEEGLTYPDSFALHLERLQYVLAIGDPAEWWDRLAHALRLANITIPDSPQSSGEFSTGARTVRVPTSLWPHLADRGEQEQRIAIEFDRHFRQMPRRPLLFLLHGDQSQAVDGFVHRLRHYTVRRNFRRLKLPDQFEWKPIKWPEAGKEGRPVSVTDRFDFYCADLSHELDLDFPADFELIWKQIVNHRRPVIFCSMCYFEHAGPDEAELLAKAAEHWSKLADLPLGQPVIVFLVVIYHQRPASLFARWLRRAAAPQIDTLVAAVEGAKGLLLNVATLPELANVSVAEVGSWVHEILQPGDPEAAMGQIREFFRSEGVPPAAALPMERLLPALRSLVSEMRARGP